MTAPYRAAEKPDDSAERAELAAFERKVGVLPRWLRVASGSGHLLFLAVTLQLLVVLACAASPLRGALIVPTVIIGLPPLVMLASWLRKQRRR